MCFGCSCSGACGEEMLDDGINSIACGEEEFVKTDHTI